MTKWPVLPYRVKGPCTTKWRRTALPSANQIELARKSSICANVGPSPVYKRLLHPNKSFHINHNPRVWSLPFPLKDASCFPWPVATSQRLLSNGQSLSVDQCDLATSEKLNNTLQYTEKDNKCLGEFSVHNMDITIHAYTVDILSSIIFKYLGRIAVVYQNHEPNFEVDVNLLQTNSQNTMSSFSNPHIRWENTVLVEPLRVAGWWHHPPPQKKMQSISSAYTEAISTYSEIYKKLHKILTTSAGWFIRWLVLHPLVGCCGPWLGIHTATGPPTVEPLFNACSSSVAFFSKESQDAGNFGCKTDRIRSNFGCIYIYIFI